MFKFRVCLIISLAALLGIVIQGTVIHSLYPLAIVPDILLVLVVLIGLYSPSTGGLLGSFFLGVIADFASAQFIGPNACASVVAFLFVVAVSKKVYADRGFAIFTLTFICSLVKSLTFLIMLAVYTDVAVLNNEVLKIVLFEAALSALCAPLLMKMLLVKRYSAKMVNVQRESYQTSRAWH